MRSGIGILLAMMLSVLHCGAQGIVVPQHVLDSIANPPIKENPALVFERNEIDAGTLSEDDAPSDFSFTFTNKGGEPLVITRVETSCGCAVANYSKQPVHPGKEGMITITYKPKGHPGKLRRNIFVYTNVSSNHPSARLTLTGEVTPTADAWDGYHAVIGSLRAKRSSLVFAEVTRYTSQTERIECVNTGKTALTPYAAAEMMPAWVSFRTEPETIPAGGTADLIITVDGSLMPGDKMEYVLIPEGIGGRPSQRSLHITAEIQEKRK